MQDGLGLVLLRHAGIEPEVVEYLKRKSGGGTVSRWLIQLPRQGMESYDVESVVQKQLVIDVQPSHATRLDVYTEQKRRALA